MIEKPNNTLNMPENIDQESKKAESGTKNEIQNIPHLNKEVLSRNQIIHMPFLEDVLNESEELLKKLDK